MCRSCCAIPRSTAGRGDVVNTPLTTPDIFPTLLGLAGVKVPGTVEGEDLSPLIRSGREAGDRAALYMGVAPFVARDFAKEYRAIRTSRYTYVRGLDGPWLLFDDRAGSVSDGQPGREAGMRRAVPGTRRPPSGPTQEDRRRFPPGRYYIDRWGYEIGSRFSVPYAGRDPRADAQTARNAQTEEK